MTSGKRQTATGTVRGASTLAALAAVVVGGAVLALAARSPTGPDGAMHEASGSTLPPGEARILRVCADPDNLPFSNERGEGFENRIAAIVAREMGDSVSYTWFPQRRRFMRSTLLAGRCDVVIGVPAGFEMARTTRPYYRSTFVFLSRRDAPAQVRSFDDPALRRLRIGLHLIGDDYENPPPAAALGRRGIVGRATGFSLYDRSGGGPAARLVNAVARGEIDVGIAWGPMVGDAARHSAEPLVVAPVEPAHDGGLPFVFDIAMGVRPTDSALVRRLDAALGSRRAEIRAVLDAYGVPLLEAGGTRVTNR